MGRSAQQDQERRMKYKLILRPEAEIELQHGFGWYELQLPGLGSQFLIAVDAAVNEIRRHPLQYPIHT